MILDTPTGRPCLRWNGVCMCKYLRGRMVFSRGQQTEILAQGHNIPLIAPKQSIIPTSCSHSMVELTSLVFWQNTQASRRPIKSILTRWVFLHFSTLICLYFVNRTQVFLGSDLWIQMSESHSNTFVETYLMWLWLVAKFVTNASGAIRWPNLQLINEKCRFGVFPGKVVR